jgi:hypothetical protein
MHRSRRERKASVVNRALFALLTLALAVALVVPASAAGQTAGQDSVSGSAQDCLTPGSCPDPSSSFVRVGANARSGPDGQDPAGTMTWGRRFTGAFSNADAQVSCLSVADHVAIIGVHGWNTTTVVFGSFSFSTAGLIRVTDGGGPGAGLDTFEFDLQENPPIFPPLPPLPPPTDCSSFPSGKPVFRNEEGDLVVTDVDPLPTSKNRCKDGGWKTFGDAFKNQGQCVAFVERASRS